MKVQLAILLSSLSVFAVGVRPQTTSKPQTPAALPPPNFNKDVQPILSESCFTCHGPDAGTAAGGLRLDTFADATKRAITPGKPDESRLMMRVTSTIDAIRMPPTKSGHKALTTAQVDILRRWIAAGAKYDQHWSLVPPKKPVIPGVSDFAWPKGFIDRFVMAQLDKNKLKPEPEADRATLLQRASLTLTGLPPTPEELDTYLADKTEGAYERAVDRLLASPRYGEHQARYWLDAVRYGDTHGLHLDNERGIFPYRDWVIDAFNRDLPFDKFTLWQFAGDLLPNPTREQLLATGYIRMNPTTAEGGAIEEEFQAKNTFDRVDTTSTVYLGMTVACARCHDHKYDPITQKDYYRLFAFFNSTAEKPLDDNALLPPPVVDVPSPAQEQQMQAYQRQIANLEQGVNKTEALAWLLRADVQTLKLEDGEISSVYPAANFEAAFATAFEPESGAGTWKPQAIETGKSLAGLIGKDNAAVYVRAKIRSEVDRVAPITVSSDDGVRVWLNGKPVHSNNALRGVDQGEDAVNLPLNKGENLLLIKLVNGGSQDGLAVRSGGPFADRIRKAHEAAAAGKDPENLPGLYLEAGPRTTEAESYLKTKKELSELDVAIPRSLIAHELDKPRPSFVLRRGEYNMKGEEVKRALPVALGRMPKDAPMDRLGFAKWLIDPQNPLVARVFVNRIWQQHFGTGLVKTSEDFGSRGEWPSNPQLLDYLAVRFRENGWSLKKLNREIVTSAAFRQRSYVSKEKLEVDPENRLISRGPRFRLDAEVIRDRALAASGLLVEQLGGRGFKPYQPDGIWEAITFPSSNTGKYERDMGPSIYRRSLYMFWKRTSPHPVMLSFDAPMRETCTVRRSRTNTPMQALVTLNEPMFVESQRVLAQRVIETEKDDVSRLRLAFELTLSRRPAAKELTVLEGALKRYHDRFTNAPKDAEGLLMVGDSKRDPKIPVSELAAWTLVCGTLMNTDEFLTQH